MEGKSTQVVRKKSYAGKIDFFWIDARQIVGIVTAQLNLLHWQWHIPELKQNIL